MNFSTQPKNTPASVAGLLWPALRRRKQPLRHFPARQLPSVEDDYEKGAAICCWQQRERGAPAWPKGPNGAPTAPSMVFNSLAKAHAIAKQWSQDANPNLLKLLSLHRHRLAYLSYSSKLYTVSGFFFFSYPALCQTQCTELKREVYRPGVECGFTFLTPLTPELQWRMGHSDSGLRD